MLQTCWQKQETQVHCSPAAVGTAGLSLTVASTQDNPPCPSLCCNCGVAVARVHKTKSSHLIRTAGCKTHPKANSPGIRVLAASSCVLQAPVYAPVPASLTESAAPHLSMLAWPSLSCCTCLLQAGWVDEYFESCTSRAHQVAEAHISRMMRELESAGRLVFGQGGSTTADSNR